MDPDADKMKTVNPGNRGVAVIEMTEACNIKNVLCLMEYLTLQGKRQ